MKLSREQKHQVNRAVHGLTEQLRAQMTDEARQALERGTFDADWRPAWWPIAADVSTDSAGLADG